MDSSPTLESLLGQAIFIPPLSAALTPFLSEDVLENHPVFGWNEHDNDGCDLWTVTNICPHHISTIIEAFYVMLLPLHTAPLDVAHHELLEHMNRTSVQVLNMLQNSPLVLAQVEQVDIEETWNTVANHFHSFPALNPEAPFPGHEYLSQIDVWLVACAMHPEAKLSERQVETMKKMLEKQPVYYPEPGNFVLQRNLMETSHGVFFDLAMVLKTIDDSVSNEVIKKDYVTHVVRQFLRIAMIVADAFDAWYIEGIDEEYMPSYPVYQTAIVHVRNLWVTMLSDPYSPVPLPVRELLAKINVKGTFDMFWFKAWDYEDFDRQIWGTSLSFFLFDWLMEAAQHPEAAGSACDRIPFLPPQTEPDTFSSIFSFERLGFRPRGFTQWEVPPSILMSRAEDDVDYGRVDDEAELEFFGRRGMHVDADDLEDVTLVPYGPRIEISGLVVFNPGVPIDQVCTICQEMFEVSCLSYVQTRACGHHFHLDCLDAFLNSGVSGSGRCPICRAQLCMRRPRERKQAIEDAEAGEPQARPESPGH